MNDPKVSSETLDALQRETFDYFVYEANPLNGLVMDKTKPGTPASIGVVGLALGAYCVGAERGFMTRENAIARTLATLRFFRDCDQSGDPDATGHKGFYYHFLDMTTGKRAWKSELSTIDTAFLLMGMLCAGAYFHDDGAEGREIKAIADELYQRADWNWARNGAATVTHGWRPESGFIPYRWEGYDEALFLYVLGLGSPTFPLPVESYAQWTATYQWRKVYNHEFLYSGPLFTHQISHLWIDFRAIQDAYMRDKDIDYFENSRRATYVQQQYAIDNPGKWDGFGKNCWGVTASDGPGPATRTIHRHKRQFLGYEARGVPDGPDDGTIAPWAVVASLPFAPEIVMSALKSFEELKLRQDNPYGFKATYNQTFTEGSGKDSSGGSSDSKPWVSPFHYGLNQGPIVLMIENYRSGLLWRLMRNCPYVVDGLRRAGFRGGWLGNNPGSNPITGQGSAPL